MARTHFIRKNVSSLAQPVPPKFSHNPISSVGKTGWESLVLPVLAIWFLALFFLGLRARKHKTSILDSQCGNIRRPRFGELPKERKYREPGFGGFSLLRAGRSQSGPGWYETARGYIRYRPASGRAQYEHRRIAEVALRRRLSPEEVVHHINGR